MALDIDTAWQELVTLKDSWNERGLPPKTAFTLFASMACRFALASEVPLSALQEDINEILILLYEDLRTQHEKLRMRS